MLRRSLLVLLILGLLAGGLGYLKYRQIQAQMAQFGEAQPPTAVSAATVTTRRWQPRLNAVGNVQAVQGVMVNNQIAGQVERTLFDSGDQVKEGQALVQLDTDVDEADLAGLKASLNLAETQLARNRQLLRDRAVSQRELDEATAELERAVAGVDSKTALIEKKTIRAPFEGQLGIRLVDRGQYLPAGSQIVALEALDPVYVDYALPERRLSELEVGQPVQVRVAAYPERVFDGQIQAISPAVDRETRNIRIRALLPNPERLLRPGMFAKVATLLAEQDAVLTLPRQAITFNTYGDSVFMIQDGDGEQAGQLVVQRRQVETGSVLGDDVEIVSGLDRGDRVVAAGQVKLRNGMAVNIVPDEDVAPPNAPPARPAGETGTDQDAS